MKTSQTLRQSRWADHTHSDPRHWSFLFAVAAFYFFSRLAHFSRDIVPEEGAFFQPGRSFWQGNGFVLYLGETLGLTDFLCNPFHKPAGTSLIAGLFSLLTPDPIVGARIVPWLVGLLLVLFPYFVTRQRAPTLALLMFPFAYRLSGHVQTDSTLGLLGYLLVSAGLVSFFSKTLNAPYLAHRSAMAWGLGILWVGKWEIAIQATAWILLSMPLLSHSSQRREALGHLLRGTLWGWAAYLAMTTVLALNSNYSWSTAVLHTPREILRIVSGLDTTPETLWIRRARLWNLFSIERLPAFVLLMLVPALMHVLFLRGSAMDLRRNKMRLTAILSLSVLLPALTYFRSAYVGDDFPRYFAIMIPGMSVLAGLWLQEFRRPQVAILWTVFFVGIMLKSFGSAWKEPGSVTSSKGTHSYRMAARVLDSLTKPDTLLVVYEPQVPYLPSRRLLVHDVIEPYPDRWSKLAHFEGKIGGMLFFGQHHSPPAHSPYLAVYKDLLSKGGHVLQLQEMWLIYLPKVQSPPLTIASRAPKN